MAPAAAHFAAALPVVRLCSECRSRRVVAYNRKGDKKWKVVLSADIPELGKAGDLVSVQNGYMANYLLPRRLAQPATAEILTGIQAKIDAEKRAKAEVKAKAKAMATALQTIGVIKIAKKVGEEGRIYGSVQASEVSEYIEQQTGRLLPVRDMALPEMKELGIYEASIKLHPEVTGFFKVQVTRAPN